MTTSDFERIGWALANEAGYWNREEHAGRCVAASIAEQLRLVWNLRGAADIAAIDEVAHTNETAVEAAIERLDVAA
jgi:hypothetical protein